MVPPGEESTYRTAALLATALWDRSSESVTHIADSGNSVYSIGSGSDRVILRLTNPAYRTCLECEAELDYLLHLDACGVRCNQPIRSTSTRLVEELAIDGKTILASLFSWAPGERIEPDSPQWNDDYIRAWGGILGRMHRASSTYHPDGNGRRWIWRNEVFLAQAHKLIPENDPTSRGLLDELMAFFEELSQSEETFGMVHGDFAPQNFNYDPTIGITAFDFGNCCYHWYVNDIAVSFTRFSRFTPEIRQRSEDLLLEGYRAEFAIDDRILGSMPMFLRLRAIYVYLSRLMKFGSNPTEEEERILEGMRGMVYGC